MWRRPRGYLLPASDTLGGGPARISVELYGFSLRTAVAVSYSVCNEEPHNIVHSNAIFRLPHRSLHFPPSLNLIC